MSGLFVWDGDLYLSDNGWWVLDVSSWVILLCNLHFVHHLVFQLFLYLLNQIVFFLLSAME